MHFLPKTLSLALALLASTLLASPPQIIFDTDTYTDIDDVGALAVLHALADAGECQILATIVCTRGAPSSGIVELVNSHYGRPSLPIAVNRELGVGPLKNGDRNPYYKLYLDMVKAKAASLKYPSSESAPDANTVYRQILASKPDSSVTVCSVGFTTNLRRLLETKPDSISPLSGKDLVAKKVKAWYAMACKFPSGSEYNSRTDWESSRIAFRDWPTPIYFLDFNYGFDVRCGASVARLPDNSSPVRHVYRNALKYWGETETGHPSWDQIAVLAAVRGWQRYFGVERGTFTIPDATGRNHWTPSPQGNHYVLTEKTPRPEIAKIIESLMSTK